MLSNLLENVKYQNFKLFWCDKGSVPIYVDAAHERVIPVGTINNSSLN